jgi:hypothetical protein
MRKAAEDFTIFGKDRGGRTSSEYMPLEQRRTSGGKQDYDRADSRMMRARAIAVVLRRRKAELAPVVVA